ncbi:helix-turn-helix transcriptional regulator [Paroceanicella profunda]|uniref:helix-turn-helix transcriptional regulator n=1 Tax=Paroceanicella profunda TaxID=2579971 RepID=UPI001EF0C6A3|nr:YafY family protein [Paroceanicella profunda]
MSRRADRLFRLVQELRGRRLAVTAAQLATALEVSERTIYRDIADLMASGVPIDGAAGVGYRLSPGYDLPPVRFTRAEVQALLVGGQMVRAFTDPGLGGAAASAEAKIRAILDDDARALAERQPYCVPQLARNDADRARHQRLREACEARRKLACRYHALDGTETRRVIWPLGLIGWTGVWTLAAWCELRDDFRTFRFDRLLSLEPTGETFPDTPSRNLAAFLANLPVHKRS